MNKKHLAVYVVASLVLGCTPPGGRAKASSAGDAVAQREGDFAFCRSAGVASAVDCWKAFLARWESSASTEQLQFARAGAEPVAPQQPAEPSCPPGEKPNGDQCVSVCVDMETWSEKTGTCVQIPVMVCPPETKLAQGGGYCIKNEAPSCPSGQTRIAGDCVRMPFQPGMRVKLTADERTISGRTVLRKGDAGTVWMFDGSDSTVFVLWDRRVGATPLYPDLPGIPQGQDDHGFWVSSSDVERAPLRWNEIPQWCGQDDDQGTYGAVKVGSRVRIKRHRPAVGGSDNWIGTMDQFVGRRAKVVRLRGFDGDGCPGVTIDLDDGDHFWRIRDMELVSQAPPRCPRPTVLVRGKCVCQPPNTMINGQCVPRIGP